MAWGLGSDCGGVLIEAGKRNRQCYLRIEPVIMTKNYEITKPALSFIEFTNYATFSCYFSHE